MYDVTGDHRLGRHDLPSAVAQDRGLLGQQIPDRLHGALRLAFLYKSDDGINDHHAEDNGGVHPVGQQRSNQAGSDEDVDEDIMELAQKTDQGAAPRRGRDAIGTELPEARIHLGLIQPGGIAANGAQHLRQRAGMPMPVLRNRN